MTTPSFGNNISASGNDVEDPVKISGASVC